ncbi:hypothetical protein H7J06_10765 [Mycobacterium hodleri]|uniref:hypothetical protein n=1 Tax=Mycolicibacterium hodleri TaxID=49897 RepID=UPI0021F2AB88|nr:hypothetical protein [Mycolicibacterium hodleri]MCV7133464.1 hypothetical protein [Mycolicibacterium hodleri]
MTVSEGATRDRYNNPEVVRTPNVVTGCRVRPLSATETVALGDVVTDAQKATCPPVPAVLDATAADEVVVDGITYSLIGPPRVHRDFRRLSHVTLNLQRITA